jgi:NTP pyrophosphatase (non-canonical NTP hydrolase)
VSINNKMGWDRFADAENQGTAFGLFLLEKQEWSHATFGPPSHRGPKGPLDHLIKEAKEAADETDPERLKEEIADCLFLAFDAATRAGMSLAEITAVCERKLAKNKARVWPDWRTADPNKAVEHKRELDTEETR